VRARQHTWAGRLALRAKAGIALDRPFGYFVGYDNVTAAAAIEQTKFVY